MRGALGVMGAIVVAASLALGGCAFDPVIPPEVSASGSPRPSRSDQADPPSPSPRPSAEPSQSATPDDLEPPSTHPPADPTLTAATAYSACKTEGEKALFTDDPGAAWQPLASSYVALVDGIWRVHSGVTTTSADVASGDPSAFCLVTGTNAAPVILTIGATISPPDDPGLWALPEG